MVCDTQASQDVFTYQILNAISKNIGDMHQFLETRSEVKFKVMVT